MATDVRGHTAPAAGETPKRQSLNDLSLSVNDFVMCTNATDLASKVAAIAPTPSRPALLFQLDTGIIYSHDGTTQKVLKPVSVYGSGSLSATTTETAVTGCSLTLPAGTWDIYAKCYADWSVSGAGPRYYLNLRQGSLAGTLLDQAQMYIGGVLAGSVPMDVMANGVVLAATTTVILSAYVTGPSGGITSVAQAVVKAQRTA